MQFCRELVDVCGHQRDKQKIFDIAFTFAGLREMKTDIYIGHIEQIFLYYYDDFSRGDIRARHALSKSDANVLLKLRNVAILYATLLGFDVISWKVLKFIRLPKVDTTGQRRFFLEM